MIAILRWFSKHLIILYLVLQVLGASIIFFIHNFNATSSLHIDMNCFVSWKITLMYLHNCYKLTGETGWRAII